MASGFEFDVFIDYAAADAKWVRESLLPHLEGAGFRVGIDFRNFEVGIPSLENRTRALMKSRWMLLVLTSEWLKGEWVGLGAVINRAHDRTVLLGRLLPVKLERCELPKSLETLTPLDFTNEVRRPADLMRLVEALRKTLPSRPKRGNSRAGKARKPKAHQGPSLGVTVAWEQPLEEAMSRLAWSADGQFLAASHFLGKISVYEPSGALRQKLPKAFGLSKNRSFAWSPRQPTLAIVAPDHLFLHDFASGQHLIGTKSEDTADSRLTDVAWNPTGTTLAVSSQLGQLYFASVSSLEMRSLSGLRFDSISSLTWSPDGHRLALISGNVIYVFDVRTNDVVASSTPQGVSAHRAIWMPGRLIVSSGDGTIRVLDDKTLRPLHTLEGHKGAVGPLALSHDGRILASGSLDNTIRLWRCDRWEEVTSIEAAGSTIYGLSLSSTNLLAGTGLKKEEVRVWQLDIERLLAGTSASPSVYYRNAKTVLVGDSSVGKSGLGLVLSGKPFAATDSTHGRRIWTFETRQVDMGEGRQETRETFLWDMAGQPGYRLIHQLHLDDVAVALVVFDAKSETDPFAGVGHWERALRTAVKVQGSGALPLRKFLVAARTDRSGIAASRDRIKARVAELGFDGYFETSAREGWGIKELRDAVRAAVQWDKLPQVSSTALFQRIKDFLVEEKKSGRLLSTTEDLYFSFVRRTGQEEADRDQFNICLGRLESRDLIRRLSFGGLVLLQPEFLDAYASAIVNEAKAEPDGLGSIAEQKVLQAGFRISADERLQDAEKERLLLVATIEDMVRREIALREYEQDGTQLVFPSQLTRENPDLPDPKGKSIVLSFEGPTQNLYATLAVRLSHSLAFSKKEMWRNAVVFIARAGGTCGVALREYGEGRGDLIVFFGPETGPETRLLFEEYVESHVKSRAIPQSVVRRQVVVCQSCRIEIPHEMVQRRLSLGHDSLKCPVCEQPVSLRAEAAPAPRRVSELAKMDRAADEARDRDAALISAAALLSTPEFEGWLGGPDAGLVLVFVTMMDPVARGSSQEGDEAKRLRESRLETARQFIRDQSGHEVKALVDSLLIAFRAPVQALAFTLQLRAMLGDQATLRAAINTGDVRLGERDTFSRLVTYTARMEAQANEGSVWVSEQVKQALERNPLAASLRWTRHDGRELPGLTGSHVLWSAVPDLKRALPAQDPLPAAQPSASVTVVLSMEPAGAGPAGDPRAWLTSKFGGRVLRSHREAALMTLEYASPDVGELLRLAESGRLDSMVAEVGARAVREIISSGERLYEEVPIIEFPTRDIKAVPTKVIEELIPEIDVVIMTTTSIERDAVLSIMDPLPKRRTLIEGPFKNSTYRLGRFGRYFAAHVESTMGTLGRGGATLTVSDALKDITPKAVIVPGIAFGVDRKKQHLGDVLVAEAVFPYELQKDTGRLAIYRGRELPCGSILSDRFRAASRNWTLQRLGVPVAVHQGLLLSGEKVIDSREFRDRLMAEFPTAVGGEMEGAGVYASASRNKVEVILVKAICDWADGHKNDRAQPFAAKTAVSLAHHVLSKPDVLKELGARDRGLPRV